MLLFVKTARSIALPAAFRDAMTPVVLPYFTYCLSLCDHLTGDDLVLESNKISFTVWINKGTVANIAMCLEYPDKIKHCKLIGSNKCHVFVIYWQHAR